MLPSRILYVEDDAVNRVLMKAFLSTAEITLVEACDGQSGLDAVEAAEFDLVFMDVRMPRIDGITALKAIRARPDSKARVPVIVVTADAVPTIQEEALAAGADGVLFKPFSAKEMFACIARVLVREGRRAA